MTGPARVLSLLVRSLSGLGLTLAGLLLITFIIGRVMPIDPVVAVVGDKASPETYAAAREKLGLDQPLTVQFLRYIGGVVKGDLGTSSVSNRPVIEEIGRVFPATIELATLGILIGVILGVPLGIYAAYRQNRWQDHAVRFIALFGYSMPVFWLGLIGLLVFYAGLGWVGGPGRISVAYRYSVPVWSGFMLIDTLRVGNFDAFRNALSHIVLPASLIGYYAMAYLARMTRAFMIEELGKEYITAARIKGASEARVLWKHALPNILVPLVTIIALSYGLLLEGTVLIETVFSWPGLGLYITNGLFAADMPAVLGGTFVVGLCFVILNKSSEIAYAFLDPRTER